MVKLKPVLEWIQERMGYKEMDMANYYSSFGIKELQKNLAVSKRGYGIKRKAYILVDNS